MAQIHEVLTLEDQFSPVFAAFLHDADNAAVSLAKIQDMLDKRLPPAADTAGRAVDGFADDMDDAATAGNALSGTLTKLAGAFSLFRAGQWLVETSDELTSIDARLGLLGDEFGDLASLQEDIYQAAQRSRGAYADTADLVAKLGTLTQGVFKNADELVGFAEQVNKQLVLSGASGDAASAAMLQLTQGLSSGTLRGDELVSVLEQAPTIAQAIADYMGVSVGEMRDLASEGAVTADVVKNALFAAADETNAAFESMPMTWAQVWTSMQNVVLRALTPVLDVINWLANNIDDILPVVAALGAAFIIFQVGANWINICTAATNALTTAQKLFSAAAATGWAIPLAAIALVIAAVYAVVAVINHVTGQSISAAGIIAGTVATLAAVIYNVVIGVLNAVIEAFWSVFAYPVLTVFEFISNIFLGGFDSIQDAFLNMLGNLISWLLEFAKVATKILDAVFSTDLTAGLTNLQNKLTSMGTNDNYVKWDKSAPEIGRIGYGDAWDAGYNWGASLKNPFSGFGGTGSYDLETINLDDLMGSLEGIEGDVGDIKKSVSLADEDIKSLVDMATREYVNKVNLTSQTPVINITGQNTGNTKADTEALALRIRDVLIEEATSSALNSHAMLF